MLCGLHWEVPIYLFPRAKVEVHIEMNLPLPTLVWCVECTKSPAFVYVENLNADEGERVFVGLCAWGGRGR